MAILGFLIKRIFSLLVTLLGVLTVVFFVSRMLPASPLEQYLGPRPTAEQIEMAKRELGLDQPLLIQYVKYVQKVVSGDLGVSLVSGEKVLTEVTNKFAASFELVTIAMLVTITLGLPLGMVAAACRKTSIEYGTRAFVIAGGAIPVFFLGFVLQLIFSDGLNWLPLTGRIDTDVYLEYPLVEHTGLFILDALLNGNWKVLASTLVYLILPCATLVIVSMTVITRTTCNTLCEVLAEDHIKAVRAYGIGTFRTYTYYAFKPTLIPVLTVIGLTYGYMIGNSVIVEGIFNWPGIGSYALSSAVNNDYSALLGATLFLSGTYLLINLLVDLVAVVIDPRFSLED